MGARVERSEFVIVGHGDLDDCMVIADHWIKEGYRLNNLAPDPLVKGQWFVVMWSAPQFLAMMDMAVQALRKINEPLADYDDDVPGDECKKKP